MVARVLPSRRSSNKEPKEFLQDTMVRTLTALQKKDVFDLFSHPVDTHAVPDYLDKISTPMDFSTIQEKLSRREYASFDEFKIDVVVVFNNAQNYNMEHTVYFRQATTLAQVANVLFLDADKALAAHKRLHRASSSTSAVKSTYQMDHRNHVRHQHDDVDASTAPDTEMEMHPPTFDLGIFVPPPPPAESSEPIHHQDDYLADSEDEAEVVEEAFLDVCTQDLDGYHTDDSYVFDAIIHDPHPDTPPPPMILPQQQPANIHDENVSDIDSDDDSSLSDGIEFMHDYHAAPAPPTLSTGLVAVHVTTAPPTLPPPSNLDKENVASTTKETRRRDTSSAAWIPRKRLGMDMNHTMSQPAKRPAASSSKKTPYKSIFGLPQPPPRARQALMDMFVVHPTAE
ncbi:hypothetical protein AaE_004471 [Aphanomyces astaci]|uniref:Bromo domain-containing protein n=1 Tax=Aphanomyces astaci TaxID=112090 RepID=A0A6A5ANC3_APHAT|nr:hypothetical protein AaE_004471 [Aphanomyces astaci]